MGKLRNMASVYLVDDRGILMLYRMGSRIADKLYVGTAGGHFEEDELNDARACVLREMEEELGIQESDIQDLKLRYITLRRKNGEIRQNYYFFARFAQKQELISNEGKLQWFLYEAVRALPMPASAGFMMEHYLTEGRFTQELYAGITTEKGICFEVLHEF